MSGRLDEVVGDEYGGARFDRARVLVASRLFEAMHFAMRAGFGPAVDRAAEALESLALTDAEGAAGYGLADVRVNRPPDRADALTVREVVKLVADHDRLWAGAVEWQAARAGTAGTGSPGRDAGPVT